MPFILDVSVRTLFFGMKRKYRQTSLHSGIHETKFDEVRLKRSVHLRQNRMGFAYFSWRNTLKLFVVTLLKEILGVYSTAIEQHFAALNRFAGCRFFHFSIGDFFYSSANVH